MLEIKKLSSGYGSSQILREVNLTIERSEISGLLGRNGMGKTTLIRSIMQLTPPNIISGSITWNGQELIGMQSNEVAMLGLGFVPQGRRLFPSLTVQEHLEIIPQIKPDHGKQSWTIARIYELFPRLGERKQHRGNQLSGGERQMLAIGRALMLNPTMLLMDEPTEGLAPLMVKHVEDTIRTLREDGMTILLVEQNLRSALSVVDKVSILETGEVVHQSSAAALAADPDTMKRYLGV